MECTNLVDPHQLLCPWFTVVFVLFCLYTPDNLLPRPIVNLVGGLFWILSDSNGKPHLLQVHFHYLLHCTCHANHREIFTTYLTSECQNFQNLDDKCKLIWILNNEDPTILRYLCQYLLSTTI